jgi:hypothetical protein
MPVLGLALLAQRPHRATRQPAGDPSAEPAICAGIDFKQWYDSRTPQLRLPVLDIASPHLRPVCRTASRRRFQGRSTERHRQEVPPGEGDDVVVSGRRLKDVPGSTRRPSRQFRAVV